MVHLSNDEKTLISLYAMVFVGSLMMLVPVIILPYAGLAAASVGFVSAYIYRMKNKANDLMQFHTNYIIRSVWISCLVLLVGLGLFGSVLLSNGDLSPIYNLMQDAEKGLVPTQQDMMLMQYQFVQKNLSLIMITAGITLLPYPLYLVYRMVFGVKTLLQK